MNWFSNLFSSVGLRIFGLTALFLGPIYYGLFHYLGSFIKVPPIYLEIGFLGIACILPVIFYEQLVGKHIEELIRMNNETSDEHIARIDIELDDIPNTEIGLLLRSREKMLSKIEDASIKMATVSKLSAIGEMSGGIAHEINNPLTIIMASSNIIKKLLEKENIDLNRCQSLLNKINNTTERISKIVISLRNLSRDEAVENKNYHLIASIIKDVLSLSQERFKSHKIDLKISNREMLGKKIYCSRIQTSQVLLNLLNNSFDAIEKNSEKWVEIRIEDNKNSIDLYVTDSGSGIPQDVKQKIFLPFFSTKEVGKGTGIGLSLSKSVMQKQGGDLTIEESQNTCFKVSLPKITAKRSDIAA